MAYQAGAGGPPPPDKRALPVHDFQPVKAEGLRLEDIFLDCGAILSAHPIYPVDELKSYLQAAFLLVVPEILEDDAFSGKHLELVVLRDAIISGKDTGFLNSHFEELVDLVILACASTHILSTKTRKRLTVVAEKCLNTAIPFVYDPDFPAFAMNKVVQRLKNLEEQALEKARYSRDFLKDSSDVDALIGLRLADCPKDAEGLRYFPLYHSANEILIPNEEIFDVENRTVPLGTFHFIPAREKQKLRELHFASTVFFISRDYPSAVCINHITHKPVAVTFDEDNSVVVTKRLRTIFPSLFFVFAGELGIPYPWLDDTIAHLILPVFKPQDKNREFCRTFFEVHKTYGLSALKDQLLPYIPTVAFDTASGILRETKA